METDWLKIKGARNDTSTFCKHTPRDKSRTYDIVNITLGTITGIIVVARTYYRVFLAPTPLGIDDYMLTLAFVSALPSTVLNTEGLVKSGLGRDIWTLDMAALVTFARWFYVMQVLYFGHLALIKVAMLLFFIRIFPQRGVKRILWATIALNVVGGILLVLMAIFQCTPVKYMWEQWGDDPGYDGRCLNRNALVWAHAGWNIALDLWMLAVPLTQVRKLHMHWKRKLGVAAMFIVGTL